MKKTTDDQGNLQYEFNCELLSVSSELKTNVNGKQYRVGTIRFEDANGKTQQVTAIIYEKNYQRGMKVGENYLATARPDGQNVFISCSALKYSERANADMFGAFESVPAEKSGEVTE